MRSGANRPSAASFCFSRSSAARCSPSPKRSIPSARSRNSPRRLEELRPAVHVHALAVLKLEPERVELPARHQPGEERSVLRVLEREEDALPALLAAQLGDLALDPDGRQPLQPRADAAVERRHRVDLPVAVVDRLDLAHEADGRRG